MKRPLPENANRIFELIYYESTYDGIDKIFDSITDPIDRIHSLYWILTQADPSFERKDYYLNQCKQNIDGSLTNPLGNFLINYSYYYFTGSLFSGYNNVNNVVIGEEYSQGKKYIEKAIEIFYQNEKMLKNTHEWFYQLFLAEVNMAKSSISTNEEEKIFFLLECIKEIRKQPIDGGQLIFWYALPLIQLYKRYGKFKDADELLKINPNHQNYSTIQLSQSGKANLCYMKGELDEAIRLTEICLDNDKMYRNSKMAYHYLGLLALYYEEKGDFIKANQLFKESISKRKKLLDLSIIIMGYYNMIRFLTNRYKISSDYNYIIQANSILQDVKQLRSKNPENFKVIDYSKICEALLLKFGRLTERTKAYEIFKEIIKIFPTNTQFIFDLFELLIDEAKFNVSSPQVLTAVINELDDLIKRLETFGKFFTVDGNIINYVQRQILISRYDFYIKGKKEEAIITLRNTLNQIDQYELPEVKIKLQTEINKITDQLKLVKDQSLQERIKKVEIEDYFKQALQMKNFLEN